MVWCGSMANNKMSDNLCQVPIDNQLTRGQGGRSWILDKLKKIGNNGLIIIMGIIAW